MLQNILTIAIELTIVAFAIVMAIDFAARVAELFESIFQQSTDCSQHTAPARAV